MEAGLHGEPDTGRGSKAGMLVLAQQEEKESR